jgi:hypothetical protein
MNTDLAASLGLFVATVAPATGVAGLRALD